MRKPKIGRHTRLWQLRAISAPTGFDMRTAMSAGAALLAITAAPQLAQAQTAPPTAQNTGIEEVVVTARRREENLEQVPMTVEALNAQQLAERSIVSQSDLQSAVPGLTLRQTQGSNSLTYSIRGQTVDVFTGSATAVVPYFDEVQFVTGGASTFFDLQSVQVLKGPQGTLFGRNATGGAVLYTSEQPQDQFGGYLTARIGDYDLREGMGALNVPIVDDKVLLRVAGDIVGQDGYQLNLFNGQHLGAIDRKSGRVTLTIKPTEKLQNTLVLEDDHSAGSSTANRLYSVNACGAKNGGFTLNCTAAFLFSPGVDTVYGAGTWAAYIAAHPNVNPAGILAYLQQDASKIPFWDANDASPVFHRGQDYFAINTTTYDLTSDMQLKNIFGASDSNTNDEGSSVGAPYLVFASQNPYTGEHGNKEKVETYSEELQLQGKALADALTYVTGAYYLSQASDTVYPQEYFDLAPLGLPVGVDDHFGILDRTEALYAQGTYDLSTLGLKGFSFTGGYRYTWEDIHIRQLAGSAYAASGPEHVAFSNPSWTLDLSYQATDDLLLYVEGRRSWRSGGFNGTAPPIPVEASGGGNLFKPEYTRDVEIGAKDQWTLFGLPGITNVALYNQWIDNVQRAEFPVPPGGGQSIAVTINVPEAEVSGIDLDSSVKLTDWLNAGVAGALTDARFVKGQNTANIFGTLYVFNPYADTPRLSGSIYTVVTLPAPQAWGLMRWRTDIYGQSDMYFSNNNSTITPNTRIGGYGLVNMRYDWTGIMGSNMSFGAYVKNLADKKYYTGGFSLAASLGLSSVSVGTPRMYGFELTYNF